MPILVSFSDGEKTSAAKVDRFPEQCPRCRVRSAPRFIAATVGADHTRQICFQCESPECRALFVATYDEQDAVSFRLSYCTSTRDSAP